MESNSVDNKRLNEHAAALLRYGAESAARGEASDELLQGAFSFVEDAPAPQFAVMMLATVAGSMLAQAAETSGTGPKEFFDRLEMQVFQKQHLGE